VAEGRDSEFLSAEEREQLVHLLHRYCETELDLFRNWVISSSLGDVYIEISRVLPPGGSPDEYSRIPQPIEPTPHGE
jgi:hypothetical protein